VSNVRLAPSGHLYLTLKDARSSIPVVMFRSALVRQRMRVDDGQQVLMRGRVSLYEARGTLQFYAEEIQPRGLGALQLAFEQLKKKLHAEGLFDQARKKPLPVLPRCIGVVTSPTGAAIRDILRVLKRRFPNAQVSVYPAKVQGASAAAEIVQGLQYFNRVKTVDVLILARGGGSLEDLWAFNEEVLARAIFASEIPVITGVGHESDFTIADFVADLRAPTPSAAAEIVVKSREEFERHIADHQHHLIQQMRYRFSQWRHRVRDLQTHRGFRELERVLRARRQQLDEMSNSLAIGLRLRLAMARQRITEANAHVASFDLRGRAAVLRRRIDQQLGSLSAALDRVVARKHRQLNVVQMRFAALDLRARVGALRRRAERDTAELQVKLDHVLINKRRKLETAMMRLEERSPFRILERGYAVAYDATGKVLRSPDQVSPGDDIAIRVAQGELAATVRTKNKA
ncbi:MAG: exodeoxyribonuclease VII large subunit, partial [Candidatus Acidiferrales bacterium]